MSNLQPNCCLKVDFQKVDKHTGGKWLIHENQGNQLQLLMMGPKCIIMPHKSNGCDYSSMQWYRLIPVSVRGTTKSMRGPWCILMLLFITLNCLSDVIAHTYSEFNDDWAKPTSLKLGHGWVITSHNLCITSKETVTPRTDDPHLNYRRVC